MEDEVQGIQRNHERPSSEDEPEPETGIDNRENEMKDDNKDKEKDKDDENQAEEDPNWLDSGSQYILDSQQLVEALSLCDDLLQVGSQDREENTDNGGGLRNKQPCFADYAHLGTEDFKRDLEECQKIALDPSNIELDTPPEFRLSQLVKLKSLLLLLNFFDSIRHKSQMGFVMSVQEFGSQESFLAWGTGKTD